MWGFFFNLYLFREGSLSFQERPDQIQTWKLLSTTAVWSARPLGRSTELSGLVKGTSAVIMIPQVQGIEPPTLRLHARLSDL